MDVLTSIVYDAPDKHMNKFEEMKLYLPTPVNRIKEVVLARSG